MVVIHSAVDHEFDYGIGNFLTGDCGGLLLRFCGLHVGTVHCAVWVGSGGHATK